MHQHSPRLLIACLCSPNACLQPEDITDDDTRELRYFDVSDGCR